MGNETSNELHMQLGILIGSSQATNEALKQQTETIARLSGDIQQSVLKVDRLESGLTKTNQDIIALRNSVLTHDKLNRFGLHVDDADAIKLDLAHARASRMATEDRKPVRNQVRSVVIAGLVLSIAAWIGEAIYSETAADFGVIAIQAAHVKGLQQNGNNH